MDATNGQNRRTGMMSFYGYMCMDMCGIMESLCVRLII